MKTAEAQAEVEAIAGRPGLLGCALVEIQTGMVWLSAGTLKDFDHFAEAASDYWRLNDRLVKVFPDLGPLKNLWMLHAEVKIAMWRYRQDMLLLLAMERSCQLDFQDIRPSLLKIGECAQL